MHRFARITSLKLNNFRNYDNCQIDFGPGNVICVGSNGAGKTNLLEAVSFLSPGRGMRQASYGEITSENTYSAWSVFARLHGMNGNVGIGTGLPVKQGNFFGKRHIRINGTTAKKAEECLQHLRVIWLTPAMDGLFMGPASERRRFLDRMVLSINPEHARRVALYEKIMRGRNKLLSQKNIVDPIWLAAEEAQMAELATAIVAARSEMVALLTAFVEKNYDQKGDFPYSFIKISDFPEQEVITKLHEFEEWFRNILAKNRKKDAEAKRTLVGPHRSDFQIIHASKNVLAERCSTGEQKSLLIGLVLAHCRLIREISSCTPILLLDEVAAHLDKFKRAALFKLLEDIGCQTWMTGTEEAMFSGQRKNINFFYIDNGNIRHI